MKDYQEQIKLYSIRTISIATFLGGPLAAGYLVGENYKSLGKTHEAKWTLVWGIISTIVLFISIFLLPQSILDKIPRQLFPLIYTGIIYAIVEIKQGKELKEYQESNQKFMSGWKAAGIGAISLLIISITVFAAIYLSSGQFNTKYDQAIATFSDNERETITFYDDLEKGNNAHLLYNLNVSVLPKWRENVEIIKNINTLEDISPDTIEKNKMLLKYAQLRLKIFETFKKAIVENIDKYSGELDQLHKELDKVLKEINK